jgi:N-acetylneuraminic acid mutarotase
MPNPRDFLRWYKCRQTGDIPEARDGHTACKISDKIYIFGGQGKNEMLFNDLYELTVEEVF